MFQLAARHSSPESSAYFHCGDSDHLTWGARTLKITEEEDLSLFHSGEVCIITEANQEEDGAVQENQELHSKM